MPAVDDRDDTGTHSHPPLERPTRRWLVFYAGWCPIATLMPGGNLSNDRCEGVDVSSGRSDPSPCPVGDATAIDVAATPTITFVDVDDDPQLADRYGVRVVPTAVGVDDVAVGQTVMGADVLELLHHLTASRRPLP